MELQAAAGSRWAFHDARRGPSSVNTAPFCVVVNSVFMYLGVSRPTRCSAVKALAKGDGLPHKLAITIIRVISVVDTIV